MHFMANIYKFNKFVYFIAKNRKSPFVTLSHGIPCLTTGTSKSLRKCSGQRKTIGHTLLIPVFQIESQGTTFAQIWRIFYYLPAHRVRIIRHFDFCGLFSLLALFFVHFHLKNRKSFYKKYSWVGFRTFYVYVWFLGFKIVDFFALTVKLLKS